MSFLKKLFTEECPTCKDQLVSKSDTLFSQIIKFCPNGHYEKEFHPALETWVETYKQ